MGLDWTKEHGIALDKQEFDWRELAGEPTSKLDDDPLTRVRIILLNGIESEAVRFQHACARMNGDLQRALARVRRVEHHQQTLVNWLLPADLSPLETTIGYEQVAIEVTADVALHEPDPSMASVYRFGMLEDFDHLYRFSALMDRVYGADANTLLGSFTDLCPGRPTSVEHRHPDDDLRNPYDAGTASPITKLNAVTIMAAEHQVHDYYMTIGPMFAHPIARQLYAEIASIEEQHVTQYESIIDPRETWLEKWLLHEATEVYNYYSAAQSESNKRIKKIWERFLDYELGHLTLVAELFSKSTGRDAAEILPAEFPEPIAHESHRKFIREVLRTEAGYRAVGTEIVPPGTTETEATRRYRDRLNAAGSPSENVARGYIWIPGTELAAKALRNGQPAVIAAGEELT